MNVWVTRRYVNGVSGRDYTYQVDVTRSGRSLSGHDIFGGKVNRTVYEDGHGWGYVRVGNRYVPEDQYKRGLKDWRDVSELVAD